jgi:hypothetical protein
MCRVVKLFLGVLLLASLSCNSKVKKLEAEIARLSEGPKIEFKEPNKLLGEVKDSIDIEYVFYNKGTEPLVVGSVRAGCGCTTSFWTKRPVTPGDSGRVVLKYIPMPLEKNKEVKKSATIDSNAGQMQIGFKASVK